MNFKSPFSRFKITIAVTLLMLHYYSESVAQTSYGYLAGDEGNNTSSYFGALAGNINTGANNTFIGGYSGIANTTATNNTGTGAYALYLNTGYNNTAIGSNAMRNNRAGGNNTVLGAYGGYSNTTGGLNTFIGTNSGYSNTTGSFNTFMGPHSGFYNTTGHNNTFIGSQTGYDNTTGRYNVFMGNLSGTYNTDGSSNVIVGYEAGRNITGGDFNTYVGEQAGRSNTIGQRNTFIGENAGYYNSTGYYNTFIGSNAGFLNTTGSYNILIGQSAGYSEMGSNKLYIESSSSTPLIYGDFSANQLSINTTTTGYTLRVNGSCAANSYTTLSDERFKQNKAKIGSALELVSQLNGYTYTFKENVRLPNYKEDVVHAPEETDEEIQETATQRTKDEMNGYWVLPEGKQYGVMAQEVIGILPELVTEDDNGTLAVNYDGFIPILIEALNEVNVEKEALTDEVQSLTNEINEIKTLLGITTIDSDINESIIEESTIGEVLLKNYPNPTSGSTTIQYQLPENAQDAQIIITNMQGQVVKLIYSLEGKNEITLEEGSLANGAYIYSLISNGQKLASRYLIIE